MSFEGFPATGLDFYDDLEVDNSKTFWEANKHIYQSEVLAPMKALCAELEAEFGTAKVFRPYRQVRFSADKTPYKTHQGAFVATAPETGYYVELSPKGVRTGAGFYWAPPLRIAAYRDAVVDDKQGPKLARIVNKLRKNAAYEIGGDRLKTYPRGYDPEHPRVDLLRHKSLTVMHPLGFDPVIHTAELAAIVRADWKAFRPLVEWISEHLPSEAELAPPSG